MEQPHGERFVMLALKSTDERVLAGKTVSPGFLFAALLWHDRDLAARLDEARTSATLSQRKAGGEGLLRKGQTARATGDLQSAKIHFEDALEKVASEPSLAGLKAEAESQRDEAQRFHGVPPRRVLVTGAQCFDKWFDRAPARDRQAFGARSGVDVTGPFLLFVCSALFKNSPPETGFVQRWVAAVR